ncbi:Protein TAR1 [Capsicum baccatum]|uniref:Protein TAR1 n=1 Tax=Capsicum baccatum TaxID=33114 RepID=A0A2G2V7Y8_CAPBA|nr:Protein TAR1 [Capsicum baccatum]
MHEPPLEKGSRVIGLDGRPPRPFRRGGLANDTCPWGPRPLLRVGKRTAGACIDSSPDSDLEAFSHNPAHGSFAPLAFQPSAMTNCVNQWFLSYWVELLLRHWHQLGKTNLSHDGINPAHVPYWLVNSPTLGEFCFTMIGRADIKGSKSNVAMNAWLPQASYPCGNFSDTSSFEFRRSKGSLGHAFTYCCGAPPQFPLASPRSGIVHHLSGPDRYAHTRTLLRRSRSVSGAPLGGIPPIIFLAPYGFTRSLTRTHVRLLGPCFKTGRMGSPQASVWSAQMPKHARGARYLPQSRRRHSTSVSRDWALAAPPIHAGPRLGSMGVPARRYSTYNRGASPAPIRFLPDNFKHSLTLFSKSFSSFPRGTCSLSVSRPYLALDGIHRPIWAAFPNNPTRRQRLVVRQGPDTTRLSLSPAPPSRGLRPGPPLRTLLQTTIRTTEQPDSKAGQFPIRSPLLRESL